jgi:PAS domain S-box-containing protein
MSNPQFADSAFLDGRSTGPDVFNAESGEQASTLDRILARLEAAVVCLDLDGRFTSLSQQSDPLLARLRETLLGKTCWEVFPEASDSPVLRLLQEARTTARPLQRDAYHPPSQKWFAIHLLPLPDGWAVAVQEATAQVSTRREAQASAAHQTEELADLQQLQHISGQLLQEDQISLLYQQVLDAAITLVHADMGSLQALVPDRNELLLLTSRGFDPASAAFWQWISVESTSACGVALRTGERVLVFDVESGEFEASPDDMRAFRLSGIRAVQSTPLVSRRGRIVGMFSTHWRRPHWPSERELRLLDVLARQAADLIERKQAEEALRESEERFRTLANHISQLAWMADATGSRFWYNQRWYDYTGTTLQQMQGRGWQSVHHPDHVGRVVEQMRRSVATGDAWEEMFPLRRQDGTYRWFLTRAVPIRDEGGQVTRWFGTATDITEHKELEQRKDEFISMASHELKTPLTSLTAYTDLLQRLLGSGEQNGQAGHYLARMQVQLTKLTRLIADLLDSAKVQAGKLVVTEEPLSIDQLVREEVEQFQPTVLRHHIHLEGEAEGVVTGDRDRLGQVVVNLLSNAVKYSPQADRVIVRLASSAAEITVSVQDFGIGIPTDQTERIFERFYRVSTTQQQHFSGLGIGLYIAAEIIGQHGGRIWADSVEGMGSTFAFALPRRDGEKE